MMHLRLRFTAVLVLCLAAAAAAQVEEIFSRHTRIYDPRGEFAALLIRLSPGGGDGWKRIPVPNQGLSLAVPENAKVDLVEEGSRVLSVTLDSPEILPRPVLRVDQFKPAATDPKTIDREYAREYAAQYPEAAFKGEFTLTDSGYVTPGRKLAFAMVGGTYRVGAAGAYRLQWSHLSDTRQLFVTFDCAEKDWPRYADEVGSMLLSLELDGKKRK